MGRVTETPEMLVALGLGSGRGHRLLLSPITSPHCVSKMLVRLNQLIKVIS